MHDYHDALPGYTENQILVDGCAECERRSKLTDCGLGYLDPERFALAWTRAMVRTRIGLPDCSDAEVPMLDTLATVQALIHANGWRVS